MPLQRCYVKGKLGWKWGQSGHCYIGQNAKKEAIKQAIAITGGKLVDKKILYKADNDLDKNIFQNTLQLTKKPKKPKKIIFKNPTAIEREYYNYIKGIIKQFTNITNVYIKPMISGWLNEVKRQDDYNSEIENEMEYYEELQNEIFKEKKDDMKLELTLIMLLLLNFSEKEFTRIIKLLTNVKPPINTIWYDTIIADFINKNINLIKGLTDELRKKTYDTIYQGLSKRMTTEQIAGELSKLNKQFEGYRSRLIARDQVSKYYGDMEKLRQKDIGIDKYIWITERDEKVRPKHASLDGMYCRWDNDSVYSDDGENWENRTGNMFIGIPGEDINCRCHSTPVINYE